MDLNKLMKDLEEEARAENYTPAFDNATNLQRLKAQLQELEAMCEDRKVLFPDLRAHFNDCEELCQAYKLGLKSLSSSEVQEFISISQRLTIVGYIIKDIKASVEKDTKANAENLIFYS